LVSDDQHPVQQFAADSSDPSFGNRVRLRCPHWGPKDANPLAGEHGIENGGELAVAVPWGRGNSEIYGSWLPSTISPAPTPHNATAPPEAYADTFKTVTGLFFFGAYE
jgi:hypothetical protein